MRTQWTKELESQLKDCVEKAIARGFHKDEGPRTANVKILFWQAVAVMMAAIMPSDDNPPTAAACASRYQYHIKATSSLKEDLERLDTEWQNLDAMENSNEETQHFMILNAIEENNKLLKSLCKVWDI
jgi:hypothetical protein